ncbi:MAG: hypothetical protein WDW38_011515 [Sanguina aurantia]
MRPDGVGLLDLEKGKEAGTIPETGVLFCALSPARNYLVTVQRPVKGEDGLPAKNLKVWDLATKACVLALCQKTVNKDSWPVLEWSCDDSVVVHMVTNTLHCYSRQDGFSAYRKLAIKGVGTFSISPSAGPPRLAAFLPEVKASPAAAAVYDWSVTGSGAAEPAALVRKAFFRCQGAQMHWNATGSAVLAMAYADFDATNQSYYGEQKLHFLPSEAKDAELAVTVPLPKEGPVHDVKWTPAGDYFVVVAGFMPSKVTLFDAKCKAVYDLGTGPYNLVWWNPFGRFLAVAGFGNLPGDILFYDKKTSGVMKQMGAVRSPAVTGDWSPDGRHFLVATTAPRLRVDNGFKVFTYYGEQVSSQAVPVLYQASWRPAPEGTYTDRPQSPDRLAASGTPSGGASGGRDKSSTPVGPPRAAAYKPPHAKMGLIGQTTSFSAAFDASAPPPGRIGAHAQNKPTTPGGEFVTKAASKNAKKRASKKKGDDGEEEPCSGEQQEPATHGSSQSQEQQCGGATAAMAALDVGTDGVEALQRRIKALQRKLKQIEQIKEKCSKEAKLFKN